MLNQKADYIVQFLNPLDENWIQTYKRICGKSPDNKKMYDDQTCLFKYLIRGIAKHLKFIDRLHLMVFDRSQVPKWINEDTVDVIVHKEFIPNQFLPTFNSTTPQIFLGNLPRINDNFILASDDFYIINDLTMDQFFNEKNQPIVEKLNIMDFSDNPWYLMVKRCNDFARKIFKRLDFDQVYSWHHFPHAFNKSTCKQLLNENWDMLCESITTTRDPNKNIATLFWVLATYFKYGNTRTGQIWDILDEKSCDVFQYVYPNLKRSKDLGKKCINLNYIDPVDTEKIKQQFEELFPDRCIYEK